MSASVFARQVSTFIDANLSPAAQSAQLAQFAKDDVAQLISTGRASPRYQRFVDGIEGARDETVKPDGVIVYRFEQMAEIAMFALGYLQKRSPVRSGDFARSFYLGLDGKFIEPGRFNPAMMGNDVQKIVIGNIEPFSRLVDVQWAGRKRVRFSVQPGIFEDAAQAVRSRFGSSVTARRVYTQNFPKQYVLLGTKHAGKRVESPAIVITRK